MLCRWLSALASSGNCEETSPSLSKFMKREVGYNIDVPKFLLVFFLFVHMILWYNAKSALFTRVWQCQYWTEAREGVSLPGFKNKNIWSYILWHSCSDPPNFAADRRYWLGAIVMFANGSMTFWSVPAADSKGTKTAFIATCTCSWLVDGLSIASQL